MFLGYIHYFRALAIFFIVAGHAIDAFSWQGNVSMERFLRILFSNGSVLFVFIAGYLFQHLLYKFNFKKYLKTKFKNVWMPYFLVSIPAIIISVTILPRELVWTGFYDEPIWLQVLFFYLSGLHLSPFWFIPMISLFYFISPILNWLDKGKVIYFILPLFILVSCLSYRGLPHQSFIYFFSAYLLGMGCSKYKSSINLLISRNSFILLSLILIVSLTALEFVFFNFKVFDLNYLQKITMCLFFLGVFFKFNSKLNSKFIGIIANTSFGVFFIHSYILTAGKELYKYFLGGPPVGNIFMYFLVISSLLLVCVWITLIIKKVSGQYSRYLVGS